MSGGIEDKLGWSLGPLLFVVLVGCLLGAYFGSARDLALLTVLAAGAAALAGAGICFEVLRSDARLAAEEAVAAAALPIGESVHSFARSGRSALLVSVRLDRRGRVLDASAFDPDHYA
ncbi:MAG: hypothetical protein AB7V58_01730 [Solirubrobacterales bacterium]